MSYVMVDIEADGPIPGDYSAAMMIETAPGGLP